MANRCEKGWIRLKDYELTERGKIGMAIIIAVFLFVIPAVTFMYIAWNGGPSNTDSPQISVAAPDNNDGQQAEQPDDNEDSHLDNNQYPDDPTEGDNDTNDQESLYPPQNDDEYFDDTNNDVTEDQRNSSSTNGAVSINVNEGTMRFWFSPSSQDYIDANITSLIGDFLESPQNTSSSEIVVEIPNLSDSERQSLISIVTDAFAEHGVAQRDLSFAPYLLNSNVGVFEIRLHFSEPTPNLK